MFAVGATAAVLLSLNAVSETPPAPAKKAPCNEARFRQFDFWVGEWEVKDASGKVVGHNSVTRRAAAQTRAATSAPCSQR